MKIYSLFKIYFVVENFKDHITHYCYLMPTAPKNYREVINSVD